MAGCGGLSDCGEECEIQLSASHPGALTLCVSDLAPFQHAFLSQCSHNNYQAKKLPNIRKD